MILALLSGNIEPIHNDWKIPTVEEKSIDTNIEASYKCNCVEYQRHAYFPELPPMDVVLNNLSNEIGDLAVFYYAKSDLYHYAKVVWTDGYSFKIDEANFKPCQITQRLINLDYPRLLGFYDI